MFETIKKLFLKGEKVKDPVCGMTVDPKKAANSSVYQGKKYYFCSPSCGQQFEQNPSQFVT